MSDFTRHQRDDIEKMARGEAHKINQAHENECALRYLDLYARLTSIEVKIKFGGAILSLLLGAILGRVYGLI